MPLLLLRFQAEYPDLGGQHREGEKKSSGRQSRKSRKVGKQFAARVGDEAPTHQPHSYAYGNVESLSKVPSPLPLKIETVLLPEFATAMSSLPSPLKSPSATDCGYLPTA